MNPSQSDYDLVDAYMADISFSKPLSREREVEIARRIQEGDTEARDALVKANLLFVISVARQFQNCGLPLSDLIGAGNLGLMVAAERFDGTRGNKFISYAVHWIRQSILVAIAEQPRTIRLPISQVDLMQKIAHAKERLWKEHGHEPDVVEIAKEVGRPVEQVTDALLHEERVRSLDSDLGEEGNGHPLADIIPDPNQELPDVAFERASDQAQLAHLLSILDDKEQYILRRYFGLEGEEPNTLEQIGQTLGVTREWIRQVKEKALAKLTQDSRSEELRALAEEMWGYRRIKPSQEEYEDD